MCFPYASKQQDCATGIIGLFIAHRLVVVGRGAVLSPSAFRVVLVKIRLPVGRSDLQWDCYWAIGCVPFHLNGYYCQIAVSKVIAIYAPFRRAREAHFSAPCSTL